jgi:hypothetical protein
MVPSDIRDFLIAVTGASASFIGLLFVAISLQDENESAVTVHSKRIRAEAAYAALISILA